MIAEKSWGPAIHSKDYNQVEKYRQLVKVIREGDVSVETFHHMIDKCKRLCVAVCMQSTVL